MPNFQKHLRIAVIPSLQRNHFDKIVVKNKTFFLLDGFILNLLIEIFGFSCKLKKVFEIGMLVPDGNWTGCIGLVQREKADIAIGGVTITEERSEVVRFSQPYLYLPITFVTDKPRLLPNSFAFIQAFSWKVWLMTLITFLVMSIFFFTFLRKKHRYSTILLHMYGNIVEQSFEIKSQLFSARLLMIFWIFGVMFISYSYKAVILAFFSFPTLSGIRNINDLSRASNSPSFQCVATKGSFIYKALKESKNELVKPIYNCIERTNYPLDNNEYLNNSTYEKVFIAGSIYFTKYKRSHFVSDDFFFTAMVGIPVSKNFCCLDVLNKALLRIAEAGLIEKYIADSEFFFLLKDGSSDTDDTPYRILTLKDLYGAFVVLIVV